MLDKLKSLFIVPEDDGKAEVDKQKKGKTDSVEGKPSSSSVKTNPRREAKPLQQTKVNSTTQEVKGTLNEKIMDKLLGVIAANNMEGFDYIEFKNSIKALDKLQMDEKTKFRSAFVTAQTIGVTVPKLLDSVDFYKKVLSHENTEFSKALSHQVASKVGDKQTEIDNYTKMIADKKEQIKTLTEDIAKHQKHKDNLKSKIEKDTVSIEQTRSDFETTYYKLVYQINEDVKKIKEYLQ